MRFQQFGEKLVTVSYATEQRKLRDMNGQIKTINTPYSEKIGGNYALSATENGMLGNLAKWRGIKAKKQKSL